MDLDELDNMLDDDVSYIPNFSRDLKKPPKPLSKQSSAKSIDHSPNLSVYPDKKPPLSKTLQVQKQLHPKENTTFENFFKQNSKQNFSGEGMKSSFLNNVSNVETQSFKMVTEQEEPIIVQRGMKPPLSRRGDNKSTTSQEGVKNANKSEFSGDEKSIEQKKQSKMNDDLNPITVMQTDERKKEKETLHKQLEIQKQSMDAVLKAERDSHAQQIERLKKIHAQQLARRLELKDFELSKMKELYEMQLKVKKERESDGNTLEAVGRKIQQNLKLVEKMECQIRINCKKSQQFQRSESEKAKSSQQQSIQRRELQLKELKQVLQAREVEFKQQKKRFRVTLDLQTEKLQSRQKQVSRKESELALIFKRKEEQLSEQIQRKQEELKAKGSKLASQQMEILQSKLQFEMEKQLFQKQSQQFEEAKKDSLEQIHLEKTLLMKNQIDVASKINELALKDNQTQMYQQDLVNRLKLIDLERKKIIVEREGIAISKGTFNPTSTFKSTLKGYQSTEAVPLSIYQKSLQQMKDDFLNSMNPV